MSESDQNDLSAEIRFETFTSGGPGGQHANRTASGVKAIHIPTGITAVARDHRSQHRNKELALERLMAKLRARRRRRKPRIPTKIPASVQQQRLEEKKRRSRVKEQRRKIDTD